MKKERTKRNILKLLVTGCATLIFMVAGLCFVHNRDFRTGVKLVVEVKGQQDGRYWLYVDKKKKPVFASSRILDSDGYRAVVFNLPLKPIKKLRFMPLQKDGVIAIKQIGLKGLVWRETWENSDIPTVFTPMNPASITGMHEGNFRMTLSGTPASLMATPELIDTINNNGADKTILYPVVVLIALLLFWVLNNLDFLGMAIFGNSKVITNMSLVFLLIIFFFFFKMMFFPNGNNNNGISSGEKRARIATVHFRFDDVFGFPAKYTDHYNDYFPFRQDFIYFNNLVKAKWLNVSPVEKVLIGKEGWLFLNSMELRPGTTEYYRGNKPFTETELKQWKTILEERQQWLAARGIHYLYVIAPNKNTIYPEYMPDRIHKVNTTSRMDQLFSYLKTHSNVPFIDLRPALLTGKTERPVYSRTDTHWNDYGAYIAHREILKYLSNYFPGIEPLPLSHFKIDTQKAGGDLAIMLSLQERVFCEDMVRLRPKSPLKARHGRKRLKRLGPFIRQGYTECRTAALSNMVMVHDSFYKRLKPFLSEHFKRALYIWDWDMNFFPQVVEKEKPRLVIDQMAERFLLDEMPVNPSELKSVK